MNISPSMADATSGVRQASTRQLTRQLHQGARKLDPSARRRVRNKGRLQGWVSILKISIQGWVSK